MITIYSDQISSRLEYIFSFIFREILQTEIILTSDKDFFLSRKGAGINYSNSKTGDGIYLMPHRLLFSNNIQDIDLQYFEHKGMNCIFQTEHENFLPFDVFAASFYMVARIEEYGPIPKDQHGRFLPEQSIASRLGWIETPVINVWAGWIAEKIKSFYPETVFHVAGFRHIPTIDIDNAWAFLHKGFFRTAASLLKSVLNTDIQMLKNRLTVLAGQQTDPYDNYDYIFSVFGKTHSHPVFFILAGDYGKFDKNISFRNPYFRKLIQKISSLYKTGIHPSYKTGAASDKIRLRDEISRVESITGKKIVDSRQHFILLKFPETYNALVETGIENDFTMGYPSVTGFRAGTCTPFFFYDLTEEKATSLKIFPFQVMDVTLKDYLGLTADEAWKKTEQMMTEVKKHGGVFVSIWHNESLCDKNRWKGFREVFEKMNQKAFEWENGQ